MSNWGVWSKAAFDGLSLGVDEWRVDAGLFGVKVVGCCAVGQPGTLRSPVDFTNTVRTWIQLSGAPSMVASAIAEAVWSAWKTWADNLTIPGLPWYPAFMVWPAPVAPPMPNVPTPLSACVSSGLEAMRSDRLEAAILKRWPGKVSATDRKGVAAFAANLSGAFFLWLSSAMVTMAFGAGKAAVGPLVPLAPVVGTVINDGRGCLAASTPFPCPPPSLV